MNAIRGKKKGVSGERFFLSHAATVIVDEGGARKTLSQKLGEINGLVAGIKQYTPQRVDVLPEASQSTMQILCFVPVSSGSTLYKPCITVIDGYRVNGTGGYKKKVEIKGTALGFVEDQQGGLPTTGIEGETYLYRNISYSDVSNNSVDDAIEVCEESYVEGEQPIPATWGAYGLDLGDAYRIGNTVWVLTYNGWVTLDDIKAGAAGSDAGINYEWVDVQLTDLYTKAELDALLSTNHYTKSEVDDMIEELEDYATDEDIASLFVK